MVLSCKLLFHQFGVAGMSKMLGVEEEEVPFSFTVPFDSVDAVFEFDQFQSHVDSYGSFLDEEKGKEEEEEEEEEGKEEGKEEKKVESEEGEGEADAHDVDVKVTSTKRKRAISTWSPSAALPQMSPAKLSKGSHLSHFTDYDSFVMSRDASLSFGGLVRGVGSKCCAWTSLEVCERITELGSQEVVSERHTSRVAETKEVEKLKAELQLLREKEKKLELSEMDVGTMEEANASLKEAIKKLEMEAKEESKRRKEEHLAEKEVRAATVGSEATS